MRLWIVIFFIAVILTALAGAWVGPRERVIDRSAVNHAIVADVH